MTLTLRLLLVAVLCHFGTADIISAYLANANDFSSGSSGAFTQMKYTTIAQNLGGGFQMQSSGTLKFLKAGTVKCHVTADVQVDNVSPYYSTFKIELNGGEWIRQTLCRQDDYINDAAQMQMFFAHTVSVDDELAVFGIPSTIRNIGTFHTNAASLSCIYVQEAETYKAHLSSVSSGYVTFGTQITNTNSSIFRNSGAYLYIDQPGLVTFFASTTGTCSVSHCYTYFYGPSGANTFYNSYSQCSGRRNSNMHIVTLNMNAGQHVRLNDGDTAGLLGGTNGVLSAVWVPRDTNETDYHVGRYNNEGDFESINTNTWKNLEWASPLMSNLGSGALTVASTGEITVNRAGVLGLHFNVLTRSPRVDVAQMRLVRDGSVVAGGVQPRTSGNWGSIYTTWYAYAEVGTVFEFQLNPSQQSDLHPQSTWNHLSLYWHDSNQWPGSCTNGTVHDPLTPLATPSLQSASIVSNNYNLVFSADERFSRLQVFAGPEADNNNCNFDSTGDANGQAYWSVGTDSQCTGTITMNRAVQDMLATCTFNRTDSATQAEFTKDITLVTTQARSVTYAQGFRDFQYTEVKSSRFTLHIVVPKTVTVTASERQVTGNITVLQALTALRVDVDSNPYKVLFTMLTSSQAPYQLSFASFTSPTALADTIVVNSPDCADTGATTTCLQTWDFSDLDIVETCPTKSTLSDALTVTFAVGCKASFTGNCITPEPASITVSFTLNSTPYCPQIEQLSLSATMELYRDVALPDSNAWDVSKKTSQFVVGATTFGEVAVSVSENAATADTTEIRTITTTGNNDQSIVVYSSSTGVGGTDVQDSGFPSSGARARFAIPLQTGTTVELDGTLDAAQTITIQVVLDVTYTVSSDHSLNPVLAAFHKDTHGRDVQVQSQQSAQQQVAGTVVVAPVSTSNGAATGSSSSSALSTSTLAIVGAVVVVLVIAVTYKAGQRQQARDIKEQSESVSMGGLRSSSCSAVDVHAADMTADELESESTQPESASSSIDNSV